MKGTKKYKTLQRGLTITRHEETLLTKLIFKLLKLITTITKLCGLYICSSVFQTTLLHFWEKTSHTMAAIHESFKGCQHYEFSTLKVREHLDLCRSETGELAKEL